MGESLISCGSHALKVQESLSVEVRLKRQVTRGKGLSKDDFPVKSATTSLVRRFLEVKRMRNQKRIMDLAEKRSLLIFKGTVSV